MKTIYFVIEYSSMAHPNQRAVAKLWLKKSIDRVLRISTKGATCNNALNFKLGFLKKFSMWYWNFKLSSKEVSSNFSFFELVMVNSSSTSSEWKVLATKELVTKIITGHIFK